MAHFLFVDESGHDQTATPHEVLAGFCIRDATLWKFVQDVHALELASFGTHFQAEGREIKGKKLLKRKVFRQATEIDQLPAEDRVALAKQCLESPERAGPRERGALAQAKLVFVDQLLDLWGRFNCHLFASVVLRGAPRPDEPGALRKDYCYLFERFSYFLEDKRREAGIIVFDELEKTKSHILLTQMNSYFKTTFKGRSRSEVIVPEPFFVHSDLTTGVQMADLAAYLIAWSFRFKAGTAIERPELTRYLRKVEGRTYVARRPTREGKDFKIGSIARITDLRGARQRENEKGNVACATKPPTSV